MTDFKQYKVVMLGNSGVGKTAIVERISNSEFNEVHVPTVGAQFVSLDFKLDTCKVTIELWDTAGQEVFRSLVGFYSRDACGAFLVADLTSKTTFEELDKWVDFIKENATDTKIILFGNKTDLVENRVISEGELSYYAQQHGFCYMEGSAKTGENISDAFSKMAELVNDEKPNSQQNPIQLNTNKKDKKDKKKCC